MFYWWFKRNENHAAPEAQQEIDLTKYDAWYVKTEVKDGEKPVFLTFDCGYENGYTPGILDVLQKHKAPAAFFVCKHFIEDQPDLIRRMKEEGHVVGNHTANHICMPENDDRTVREEIAENADYMKEATGYEMDPFFRPPKGEYSERTLQITKNMGYTTIFWSLAYVDYDVNSQPGADYVINQFNQYIHPGAIPLIHNISESNAQALDTVLTNLENAGYTFCSLYELSDTAATGNSGSSD
ncbi:MAG: polysaccharide deacetylase family protein [Clostridiales bacterium]|nr:polysaccharide deacetylase family protein [Clostridiales bacterium]